MKELKNRWKAETPEFWQKVGRIGLGVGAVGAFLISGTVVVPALLVTIGGYMVAVGSVTKVLSKLTVKDSNNESF